MLRFVDLNLITGDKHDAWVMAKSRLTTRPKTRLLDFPNPRAHHATHEYHVRFSPTRNYVRIWGHKDETATWSQSSDSIDGCFRFHSDKITAYGAFPGF